jgi:hypothetical protein
MFPIPKETFYGMRYMHVGAGVGWRVKLHPTFAEKSNLRKSKEIYQTLTLNVMNKISVSQ